MANRKKFTKTRRRLFLDVLRENANVTEAAEAAGMERKYMYRLKDQDPEFAEEWDQAVGEVLDRAEQELIRRAVEGVRRPIVRTVDGEAKVIGTERVYSDKLLEFFLQSRHPEYAKKVKQEMSGPDGGPIPIKSNVKKVILELPENNRDKPRKSDDDGEI